MTRKKQVLFSAHRLLAALTLVVWIAAQAQSAPRKIISEEGASMVLVQAGELTMGSDEDGDDEKPVHGISLDAY